ncbi:glycosyltransferase family 25 protein [Campylobacter sp. 9BO]|uniref:glycosyltransferase family 25 protein n=1 Tax=Campylobacter sp. 9BO TaxID=3424759 RepID=UPI003D34D965
MDYPVFLISLASDELRRQTLKERFTSYDKFNLINAVDGRSMLAKEYFSLARPSLQKHGKLLSPGEVGCTLSHMKAYEEFLKSGAKLGLIIEDDVIGDDECVKLAFEMASKMPENAILHCGCQDWFEGRFSLFAKKILASDKILLQDKDTSLFCIPGYSRTAIWSTAAYVVTKQSAESLLNTQKHTLCVSDHWDFLLGENGLKMYFCDIFSHPKIGTTDSNIESERSVSAYRPSLKARIDSFKFLFYSRFDCYFRGYERVFKAKT